MIARFCSTSLLHFRPRRVRDVYAAIDQLVMTEEFSVTSVCPILEVSRSGFATWRSGQISQREMRDRELMPLIGKIFWDHKRRYEARRIAEELQRHGVARVARLVKTLELQAVRLPGAVDGFVLPEDCGVGVRFIDG